MGRIRIIDSQLERCAVCENLRAVWPKALSTYTHTFIYCDMLPATTYLDILKEPCIFWERDEYAASKKEE